MQKFHDNQRSFHNYFIVSFLKCVLYFFMNPIPNLYFKFGLWYSIYTKVKIFYFLQHFLLGKRRSNVNLLQSSKLFAAFVLKTEFTEWACLCVSTNASVSVSRCAVAIEIAGGQHDNKHAACHLFISTYLHTGSSADLVK